MGIMKNINPSETLKLKDQVGVISHKVIEKY